MYNHIILLILSGSLNKLAHTKYAGITNQNLDNKYFADIQIYPNEFSISFDLDEPDDDISYTLESKEQLYREISKTIALLK